MENENRKYKIRTSIKGKFGSFVSNLENSFRKIIYQTNERTVRITTSRNLEGRYDHEVTFEGSNIPISQDEIIRLQELSEVTLDRFPEKKTSKVSQTRTEYISFDPLWIKRKIFKIKWR
ncbi:hypothetical protein ACFL0X_00495 [Nanoarchaeota archaeon]